MLKKTNSIEKILDKIYHAGSHFLEPLSTEELYKRIVVEAVKLVDATYGSLILERDGELVRIFSTLPVAKSVQLRKRGYTYQSFKQNKAFIRYELGKIHPQIRALGIKANIFIPLSYKSKTIGVLIVNSARTQRLGVEELDALKLFGSFISLAIIKTQLYDETRQALETRDVFISMAAHELRTPLTAVNGYIQLLKSKLSNTETSEGRWVNQLYGESVRMTNLINELLAINKIKSGQLDYTFKEISLKDAIDRAIEIFRVNSIDRISFNNELNNVLDDRVVADFDKLVQVITNLLDNAVKFSPPDTEIVFYLTATKNEVILKIKDIGTGIKKNDISKIFDVYYVGKDHNEEGFGVGLFLVKTIVTRHHGSIKVRSTGKRGTTVEVRLPKVKKNGVAIK